MHKAASKIIDIPRIALLGKPGAGKSTTAKIFHEFSVERSICAATVNIAAPLYDMQKAFFKRLGSNTQCNQQDGKLLNFFGMHFRAIKPDFLLSEFEIQCNTAMAAGADILICDDARPIDLIHLKEMGFTIIEVFASPEVRLKRKQLRGDITAGDDNHSTELGYESATIDKRIINEGTIEELKKVIFVTFNNLVSNSLSNIRNKPILEVIKAMVPWIRSDLHSYISDRYREEHHQIASVLLAADGRRYYGMHIEAMVGRASSCAETSALEKFCDDGQTKAIVLAALRYPKSSEKNNKPRFVAPCGLCRELLSDYVGNPYVLIDETHVRSDSLSTPDYSNLIIHQLSDLLPVKYRGTKWDFSNNVNKRW